MNRYAYLAFTAATFMLAGCSAQNDDTAQPSQISPTPAQTVTTTAVQDPAIALRIAAANFLSEAKRGDTRAFDFFRGEGCSPTRADDLRRDYGPQILALQYRTAALMDASVQNGQGYTRLTGMPNDSDENLWSLKDGQWVINC